MMNLACFNDRSVFPLCKNEAELEDRIEIYILTLKSAGLHGIKKVSYSGDLTTVQLSDKCSVQDYCNTRMKENGAILILSMFTKPQVPEEDDEVLERYLETETYVDRTGVMVSADGFNAAFCIGTYCVGFASDSFWSNSQFQITVFSSTRQEKHSWYCMSSPAHFLEDGFHSWVEQFLPISLLETPLAPNQKRVELRDDHGKDKLGEHAARLINCPYVEGILTSLEFKGFAKSYISKNSDFAHGLLDVVLFWEDAGFSMRVKTTGRCIRETRRIAEILTKEFGRGR